MCPNKAKFDSEPTLSYSVGLPSLPKLVTVVHGSFYSYKTARTCSEPRSVEHRLSFTVEVRQLQETGSTRSLENNF